MRFVSTVAGQQGHCGEKAGAVHRREHVVLGRQSLLPSFPVIAQVEFIGREGCRHQLEDGERHATGIDLLEHLAHGFAWRVLGQFDGGHLELLEAQPDFVTEPLHELHGLRCELVVRAETAFPGHETLDVEQQCHGEEPLAVLQIRCTDVQIDLAAEVRRDLQRLRHREDGIFAVGRFGSRHLGHVKEVEAANVAPFSVRVSALAGRCAAPGTSRSGVADHQVRGSWSRRRLQLHAGKQPGLERHTACLQKHDRADRVGQRQARDQRPIWLSSQTQPRWKSGS
jgi:hypothetical protein